VWPLAVVEHKVFRQTYQQLAHDGVTIEVHVFMLDTAPQALDKDVVKRTTSPIYAAIMEWSLYDGR
jgi:hypothetical protein